MGVERMHTPKYWRMRAEEFRTKADNCQYPETRDTLRKVAENYEELARSAEQVVTVTELDERNLETLPSGPKIRGRSARRDGPATATDELRWPGHCLTASS
jgi:hypothetical protein